MTFSRRFIVELADWSSGQLCCMLSRLLLTVTPPCLR